ncbi:MAG: hypothetical protein HS111_21570 [Kofleriaceae bacterium]|nr:hypothetical protein [Kofleriaceae bacterium]
MEDAAAAAQAADPLLDGADPFPGVGFERRDAARQAARPPPGGGGVVGDGRGRAGAGGRADQAPAAIGGRRRRTRAGGAIARRSGTGARAPALRGDGTGLRELLLERVTAANGELRTGTVEELVTGWSKIGAVRLASGEELGAGQVVAALPLSALVPTLGKKPPRRLVELEQAQRRLGWRYTLNLVIDAAAVPEGMAPTVLVLPDDALRHGHAVFVGEPDDQGRVVVTLGAILPATEDEAAGGEPEAAALAARAAALRARLLTALDDVMPYVMDHLVVAHSPHEATAPVASGRGTYEAGRGLPVAMSSVWRGTLDGAAGLAAAPHVTGVKNLTLASSQVLTGLGLEGDLVCGWNAARLACAIAGKKRDYLRDEVVSA